jgi:hypothetical protein
MTNAVRNPLQPTDWNPTVHTALLLRIEEYPEDNHWAMEWWTKDADADPAQVAARLREMAEVIEQEGRWY